MKKIILIGDTPLLNSVKNFITANKKDLIFIAFLSIFLLIISVPKLMAQYDIGIGNWDTYLYLENGRNFAKMGWGDVPSISPVLPMILSKMFLLAGHPYQEAIFNIDVVFYIIGVITFYLLLRLKFNHNTSLVGSVVYATFTLLYSWVAIGGNDIIGVTGTILTIYLILLAHRYDNRIYYIALPIAAYAFLSRYTAGVMIFSIAFYWLVNRIDLKEIKHIIIGGILGVVSISWFLYQFNLHLGTPFPFLGQFSGTVSNTVVMDSGFLPDSWYYIKHIPNYLISNVPYVETFNAIVNPMGNIPSIFSYVYIALFALAFVVLFYKVARSVKDNNLDFSNKSWLLLIVSLIIMIEFLISLGDVSYIISIVMFLASLYIIWITLKDYEIKDLDYELLMISLLVIYLVFQSILFTKNDRYFITVLPFFAYFITYALDWVFDKVDSLALIRNIPLSRILSVVIILGLLANTLFFVSVLPTDNDYEDIGDACKWLAEHEHVNNSTLCYSDNWPAVSWYLNIYCQRGVPNTTDVEYQWKFSEEILTLNDTHMAGCYYIDATSALKVDYPGMIKLEGFDTVQIYKNKYFDEYGHDYIYTDEYKRDLKEDIDKFKRY